MFFSRLRAHAPHTRCVSLHTNAPALRRHFRCPFCRACARRSTLPRLNMSFHFCSFLRINYRPRLLVKTQRARIPGSRMFRYIRSSNAVRPLSKSGGNFREYIYPTEEEYTARDARAKITPNCRCATIVAIAPGARTGGANGHLVFPRDSLRGNRNTTGLPAPVFFYVRHLRG